MMHGQKQHQITSFNVYFYAWANFSHFNREYWKWKM